MKISLNWIKQFTDINLTIEELIHKLGSQLGAVEGFENLSEIYKDVLIVRVVESIKHEEADKLNVCKIDDGGKSQGIDRDENGLIQVVCGAPNVRSGMLVAWIPPKAIVPSTFHKEPFQLEARELRGKISHGMLASQKELSIGDSHEGLLEIDIDVEPGTSFASTYQLDDYVIDLENKMFTHRPDCFGILGIAREISGIEGIQFVSPDWYKANVSEPIVDEQRLTVNVENQIPELAARFVALAIDNVQIKPSPILMQSYLSRIGIRPINNIVDITNYMMVLTGQPLHAYDYDKCQQLDSSKDSPTIIVRHANKNEKLTLLNGKEIELNENDITIANNNQAIGLAGIMGGSLTEVDAKTTRIILECATFGMYEIRKSSMKHGIFSDAVTRFTKGQSPKQNMAIALKSLSLIYELSGGTLAGSIVDIKPNSFTNPTITITADFVNDRLGTSFSMNDIGDILSRVEMGIEYNQDNIVISSPFWRTDIEIPEDIVEEVGRLHGYFKLNNNLPKRSISPSIRNKYLDLHTTIRSLLSAAGANEIVGNSFVHGDLLAKINQNPLMAYQLSNAISPELQYFRLSLTPSLLELIYPNIRSNQVVSENNEFALFEIDKFHSKGSVDNESLPNENRSLSFVFSADSKTAKKKYDGAAYYMAKKYLTLIADKYNLPIKLVPLDQYDQDQLNDAISSQVIAPYDANRSAIVSIDNKFYGIIGEYKKTIKKNLKLPEFTAGFEVNLDIFNNASTNSRYKMLPKFPKIHQDICFKVSSELKYSDLFTDLWNQVEIAKPENTFFEIGALDIFQKEDDPSHKQVTFRLLISAYDRTLTSELINKLIDTISNNMLEKLSAERI